MNYQLIKILNGFSSDQIKNLSRVHIKDIIAYLKSIDKYDKEEEESGSIERAGPISSGGRSWQWKINVP